MGESVLPSNFFEKVVGMENQLELRGTNNADETYAKQILELMSLYSVSVSPIGDN